MSKIARTAIVRRGDAIAGRLQRTEHGAVFEYDAAFRAANHAAWDRGIAYGLPFARPRVETRGTNVHPFFAGGSGTPRMPAEHFQQRDILHFRRTEPNRSSSPGLRGHGNHANPRDEQTR